MKTNFIDKVGSDSIEVFVDRITALDNVPLLRPWKGAGTKRNALVHLHIVSNHTGSPDNDPGSVIDEEAFADFSTWMDIDAGNTVAYLSH